MKWKVLLITLCLTLIAVQTQAAPVIFYGEDLNNSMTVPLSSYPNSTAAQTAFLANLVGVGTETFESFSAGTMAPLGLSFAGAGTATLTGLPGNITSIPSGSTNGVGRYAISGTKFWDTMATSFVINFSAPISAFGFYGIDVGDGGGQLTLALLATDSSITNLTVNNRVSNNDGSVLYYGFYDLTKQYTQITFGKTAGPNDVFAFDDMTIGSNNQVIPTPEPATFLYFPHVDTSLPWQTEIAIINTSDQTVTGTLRAINVDGQLVDTKAVTLSARGRRQITVADEFTNHTDISYVIFVADSDAVQGYTKFYQAGIYRAAIPAVKEVTASDIYVSHIASDAQWWTGISLVNTTSSAKEVTMTFNNGQSKQGVIDAHAHVAFTIASLFDNQPQPDIKSAVITNAGGIIGLELFGTHDGKQLEGIPLTDKTASTLYYPHVDTNGWWTGIVAYNPSALGCTITITPYDAQGTSLSPITDSIVAGGKYVGVVSPQLGFPSQTAWFKVVSTRPLVGFELFGSADGNQLGGYAGGGGTGAKAGVFAKIEKNGWTGIAFVNAEESAATVTLTAYNDAGTAVATQALTVGGHTKVVRLVEAIFSKSISSATYITYTSDKNVVGFQLNGSSDGMMLDGLPGL